MNWTPPAAARAAAARALEVRATLPRSQRAGTPVGIARAVALRDGRPISLDTARRMLAFFTRSARFEAAPKPSKSWQAWNLWGGSAARDALEHDPMICLPCMNPRAPVETAAAACMREIAHRSNPPKMPRTAKEARAALAAAYDDAVGRARVGAFRGDLSSTRAALDDAARYSYALGFYGSAPAVPYYLLDRMRAPADARQPDLFARSNPAPALPTVADLQAIKKREKDPIPVFTAWRGVLADYLAAEGYDVAHDPRGGGRTEWTDTGQIAHYIETTDDGDALIYVVDEFGPRAKIKTVYTAPGLIAVARAASKDSPRSMNARVSEAREQHRAQVAAARENAPPPEPKRRPWATQPKNQPPRSLEAQAADAREYIAIYEQQAADARAAGNKTLEMLALDDVATYRADLAAVLADMEREEARQAAEDAALSSSELEPGSLLSGRLDLLYESALDEYIEALRAVAAERVSLDAPAPAAPPSPLEVLGAQVEAAAVRAEAAAVAADAVKGKRPRRAARAAADAAADEYADALRARDALSERMGDEAITAAQARARLKRPAPAAKPSKPSKPSAPRRPVTGKAREVLARLGALGPVSLADVARVGCTDDTGARRIVAALIRAEAAAPAGPGAWMLDPARLDECPPQRPRTREPRPVCVGECGKWTPPKDAPAWIAALGPTSTIYDSEGRPYPVRWALARLDTLGDGWHASNIGGKADPKYDRELQARERGSSASRAQVEKIAGSLSLAQWVAPSSTPADSAPVVWIDPSARGHVVSGNGRTAAYVLARPSRLAVAETVGGRWKIPKTLRAALESADLVPVRIMGGPGEIDRAAAVLLAGASQASASGSLTQTERALSTVRALGLTVADMPALDWPEALTVARLVAFIAANRAWASWATAPLAPERAILLSSDPLALTVHFRDVLIGLLPPEAREGGIGGLSIDRALVGALPGIWTLETRIRDGRAPSAWSLVAVLPEARGWARKSAGRLKEIAADAATDERQAGLFGPARLDTEGARLLAVALGGALARASGRTDPEAAGAEMVAALLAAAPDPSQPSLLGIDDTDPVEVLARKARLSLPRSNPPGRDLARLSDAAKRWHWGRYKRAKSARVDRATWQPSQGFALGELAAISLGADRLEVPPGHLLCATEEGDGADLFVVPPLPLGSLAPRPLRAVEYLADKAGDGPSWYVHDFDPAYPQATTKGGALAIIRKGSRFSIDPERGIVG